ncbi:MAG: Uma2 family endonuclease [Acidobacteriota bacterium]
MGEPARRFATYEDLLQVPDHMIAEIIDGELVTSPRPGARHTLASSVIGADLVGHLGRGPGGTGGATGWWILDEPELHLGVHILVPDLAGWKRERMPQVPDVAFFTLAPDWVCEVVSPRSSRMDRVRKKRIYAREGIGWLWIVDPNAQTLEVSRRAGDLWQDAGSFEATDTARAEPFSEIEIDLAGWWA